MNVSGVSASTMMNIANTATQTGDAVAITMQKKAMDMQASTAAQLLNAVPSPAAPASGGAGGGTLGTQIDVHA